MTKDNRPVNSEISFYTLILDAWKESVQSSPGRVWQFRLRDVRTGERRVFRSLDEFLEYLQQHFDELR